MPLTRLIGSFLLFFLYIFPSAGYGQQAEAPHFYLYEDSSKTVNAETALALFDAGKFQHTSAIAKNVGFTRSIFWLAYVNHIERQADSMLLFIGHHHINRINFYLASNEGVTQQWLTGDYFPFKQRPIQATGFYFPISNKGIYLAKIDKSNESFQLSYAVSSRIAVLTQENYQKTIMALFSGMILLLVIFGVYLFIIARDRIYLYYLLYMASGWLWVLANSGHGFQYLWPDLPWFASKARPVFAIAPLIFSSLFLRRYIGGIQNKTASLTVSIVNWVLFACIISILLFRETGYQSSWWFYVQFLIPLVSLVFVVVTLAVLIAAVWRGNKLAMFYLAAIIVLFSIAFLQIFFSFGKFEAVDGFLTHFGVAVGYVVEAIILTAGLVYRFNQYRLDKENLLLRINRQQQENTKMIIEVQEAERSQIANQLHDVAGSLLSAARLNLSSYVEKRRLSEPQPAVQLERTTEAIGMVSDMVRNLSHALSPVMLEKAGFKASLEKIIAIVNASGKINIALLVTGFDLFDARLNKYYTALYNISYELLNNIVKHSGAENVLLQVTNDNEYFVIVSEDDGIGMELTKIGKMNSLGFAGIQSKVDFFKGNIAFDPNQPTGLVVTIEIPYTNEDI